MVSGEYDQRVLKPDLLIHIGEEVRERPVEPQDVVLGLETRGPEEMTDVIGRRVADTQVVGDLVIPQSLPGDEGLGEVSGHLVARRADREECREIGVLGCRELVGEGTTKTVECEFPLLVVMFAEEIGVDRAQ